MKNDRTFINEAAKRRNQKNLTFVTESKRQTIINEPPLRAQQREKISTTHLQKRWREARSNRYTFINCRPRRRSTKRNALCWGECPVQPPVEFMASNYTLYLLYTDTSTLLKCQEYVTIMILSSMILVGRTSSICFILRLS